MIKNKLVGQKNPTRLMAIDYLKALAIVLVIINHSLSEDLQLKIGGPFWISMAVPIFMIVSGFTYAMSADRNKIDSFKEYFTRELIIKRLSRFILPFVFIFALELVLKSLVAIEFQSPSMKKDSSLLLSFLSGGGGPGGYYVPLLVQLVFIFPCIYFLYKRSPLNTILLFFSIQLSFDILTNIFNISGQVYRLLIFRYLSLIVMGIVLYFNKKELKKNIGLVMVFSIGSIVYAFIVNYTSYDPVIFIYWTQTALPMVFFAFAMVILAMKYLEIEDKNILTHGASLIGKASFHIFLVQKLLFGFGLNKILRDLKIPILPSTILALVLSSIIGISFYKLEVEIRRISN